MRSKQQPCLVSLTAMLSLIICCSIVLTSSTSSAGLHLKKYTVQSSASPQAKPLPAPARWLGLIGEYGPDDDILIILEKDGKLWASFKRAEPEPLDEIARNVFKFPAPGAHALQRLIFERNRRGRATQGVGDAAIPQRRQIEPESGNQLRVKP